MYDGSIVKVDGELYMKTLGQWVLLAPDSAVWRTDEWMKSNDFDVVAEISPLDDVAEGTVVACEDGSIVAVYQGAGDWAISGEEGWYSTDRMLEELGYDWKIIYKAGDNDA